MDENVSRLDERERHGRPSPADLEAERGILGAMMLWVDARTHAARALSPEDFFRPAHGHLFAAILGIHGAGADHGQIDTRSVADVLRRSGLLDGLGGVSALVGVLNDCAAPSTVPRLCTVVAELHALRTAIGVCGEIVTEAYAIPSDVGGFLDRFVALARNVEVPTMTAPNVVTLDDFSAATSDRPDWVIPPFLERGDRMILVAAEGVGKGVLLRQLAVAAGQGVNPFTLTDRMTPQRTLLIDLENPASIIRKTVDRMLAQAITQVRGDYDPDRTQIWHEPAGIDIRSRADFARLDAALAGTRPDLVCVGPLYKLFRKQRGESDEDAALDVTARLDDLRTRHGFTLVIEHHAPKGPANSRELAPFGSAVWLRWPEFGPALYTHPEEKQGSRWRLVWGQWRGPRDMRPWPREMRWGDTWPWRFEFDEKVAGYSTIEEGMF